MDQGERERRLSDRCRLYLISPPKLSAANFLGPLKEALSGGDVASFQLRLKNVSDDEIRRAADTLRPAVQAHNAAFILNDRPDLAAELGCDGVHVGQDDASYSEARRLMPNGIVGVTCHDSRHLAMEAGEAGADYVAFGAFFPTQTKEPGGITVANARPLVEAGADFLAVAGGVWDHPDGPEAAVKGFNSLLA
jgi:thiamine-phosphate pyrophosphorylase